MSAQTVYSGPGKVFHAHALGNFTFHADGENGPVKASILEKRNTRQTATFGYHRSTIEDQYAEISFTPFDLWASLPVLFPTYLGVTCGATTGALSVGTRPHDVAAGSANGNAATKIWTPDGRLYNFVRTAITGHPNLKLGVGQSLYDQVKITALLDAGLAPGASSALIAGNAITETAASDPDTAGFTPDFINGHWTGAWAAITGFTALEVEDFWTLSVNAKYTMLKIQGLSRHMKLDSVEYMVKGRLAGPTHTQLAGKILAHTLGGTLTEGSASDLVLTGPSSKTVTLKDCEVFLDNQGFEFGGTKLGTGEVAFVSKQDFSGTPSVPTPTLIFSA